MSALGLALLSLCFTAVEPPRPNVVILLCDDLGYGDLGCFGHPTIKTPHLDQLAREGWRLTDCYSAAPVCSPSRVGLLTGRTPQRLGIIDWIPAESPMHLKPSEITFAALLKQAGYQTCQVGKWHANGKFNSAEQPQPGDHGFDHWFATQNNAGPNHENPRNFVRNGKPVGPLMGFSSELIVTEALDWLKRRQPDQPFLLHVCFHSPHEQVVSGPEFVKPYLTGDNVDEAQYFGNVAQVDHEVGRLMKSLKEQNLERNTLVFFSSDNGPETLNRYKTATRSHGSPGPLRGMKLHLTEAGYRVPGILRWPAMLEAGRTVSTPMAFVDVLPTLAALAGAKPPTDRVLDGTSWLPLFRGEGLQRTQPLYWQYDRAIGSPFRVAIRDGDWKLLADAQLEQFALYRLTDDIGEQHDLAAQQPERVRELAAKLKAIHASVKQEQPEWPPGPGVTPRMP